jgi:hypothetical protein
MKVQGTSDIPNIPPASLGMHRAVCCQVVDRGLVNTQYGTKHKGWFIFQVEELIEGTDSDFDGKRKEVRIGFNNTLARRSTLRAALLCGLKSHGMATRQNQDVSISHPAVYICVSTLPNDLNSKRVSKDSLSHLVICF